MASETHNNMWFWDQGGVIWLDLPNLIKWLMDSSTKQHYLNWTFICPKNAQNINKEDKNWFSFMMIHRHIEKASHKLVAFYNWELHAHRAFYPDEAPTVYLLFASLGHELSKEHFSSFKNVKNVSMTGLKQNWKTSLWSIHKLQWKEEISIASASVLRRTNLVTKVLI